MSSLTDSDRAYVQRKLGIGSDEAVFTDAELDDAYTRAEDDLARTVVECLEDLLVDQAKQASYKNGLQEEAASDVFKHLMAVLDYWKKKVSASNSGGMRVLGLRSVPTVHRDRPQSHVDSGLRRRLEGRDRRFDP